MTRTDYPSCEERVEKHKESRLSDLRRFFALMHEGEEPETEELGNFYNYGLSFGYVEAGTFDNQEQGFWRYQFSCGGPQEELRFFGDREGNIHKVEFWFLDWFDGAHRDVTDHEVIKELITDFEGLMAFESAYKKAMNR